MDLGIETAEKMLLNFARSGHPVFRGISALERGESRSKESGKTSKHFNGSTQIIELLLQIVISVNQLSIYRAAADMIEELPVGQGAVEKPKAPGQLDKVKILTQPLLAETHANEERQGNLLQEYEQRFEKCQKTRSYPNCAMLFCHQEEKEINLYAENIRIRGGSRAKYDLALSRTQKFAITTEDTVLKFRFNLCFKIKPYLGFEL